jgi:hypothetical protein
VAEEVDKLGDALGLSWRICITFQETAFCTAEVCHRKRRSNLSNPILPTSFEERLRATLAKEVSRFFGRE